MNDDTQETRDTSPDPTPGSSSSASTPSRQRIGQYEIRSVIASGGMGVVYEAFQQSPRRPVALKIMRLGLASASARERFEREAQLLARLHHSGIVQVFEAGTHQEGPDQVPFIAMEFIPGARTITQYATAKGLKPLQVVELLIQVCAAVQHGNETGIIHRDLKPSNLLVDQDGNVKVIDFGVARALDNDIASVTLQTHIGQLVGTVHYMSPEQIGGDSRSLDARTDVYSLGVVLYELLSGKLPFDLTGKTLAEASRIVQGETPTRLSTITPQLDPALETIVNKAMARERTDRYASVRGLSEDLSRWTRGEEPLARAAGPVLIVARASRRWAGRNRFAACILLVIMASVFGWTAAHLLVTHVRAFAPIAISLQKVNAPAAIERFQYVKLITLNRSDKTITAEADAAAAGIAGVTNDNIRSWRLIHAAIMKKVANSGARALAFDIHFAGIDSQSDEAMLAGIATCDKAHLPLILFRPHWPENSQRPDASIDRVLSDPRIVIGIGAAPQTKGISEHVAFANKRGNWDPWPGLALAAWAGAELGRDPIQYSYDRDKIEVIATSRQPNAGIGQVMRQVSFPVTSIQPATFYDPTSKTQVGDMSAVTLFAIPTEKALTEATVSVSEVLAMNESQLREVFRDKIVVVADAAREAILTLRDGIQQPGYVLHLAAIEGMSTSSRPHLVEDGERSGALNLFAACCGLGMGMAVRKLCAARTILIQIPLAFCASTALVFVTCYFSPNLIQLIIHPFAPMLSAAVASGFYCLIFSSRGST